MTSIPTNLNIPKKIVSFRIGILNKQPYYWCYIRMVYQNVKSLGLYNYY